MTALFLLLISFLALFVCFCPFPDPQHPLDCAPTSEEYETPSAPASTQNGHKDTAPRVETLSHPFPRRRHAAPKHSSRAVARSASVPTLTITCVAHESSASSLS